MKLRRLLLAVFMGAIASWIHAQEIKIDGDFRPRAEFRQGYKKLPPKDAKAAFAISQRTRLNAFYNSEVFKAYISAQDVRVWGDVAQLDMGAANKFAIHQAWGEFFITKKFSLKLGRQELVYDDARIFGNVDWVQQARAHDLSLIKYESGKTKLHVGLAFNQKSEVLFGTDYIDMANYKAMQFLWFHTDFAKAGLSILVLNNGVESLSKAADEVAGKPAEYKTVFSQTVGARLTPKLGPVDLAAAVYYQMGKINNDSTKISAMYFALEGNFKASEKMSLSAGFEYLSGTSLKHRTEEPNTIRSFNPLYGTNHKFNGHMDYFYVGNHINNVGLVDIYATLNMKMNKWSIFATPHYFMAATGVYRVKATPKSDFNESNYDNLSKGLGLEIDFGVTYAPQKNMLVQMGISEMFGTETLAFIQGYSATAENSKNGTWAYLMFVFKPEFYNSTK